MADRAVPEIGDALGSALLAELESPGAGDHVLERDDGLLRCDPGAWYFTGPDDWYPGEAAGLAHASGSVLDVGAGAGRHALELQRRGFAVTALDRSPGAAEVCRRRGVARAVAGIADDFVAAGERFDTLVLLGHNLGLLESEERSAPMLDALGALAAPGAVLIGSGRDPYRDDRPIHRHYLEWNRQRGRLPGQWRMRTRWRNSTTPWFDWLHLSLCELLGFFEPAGWDLVEHHEDEADYVVVMRRR